MIPVFLSELVRTVIIMTITGGLLCLILLVIKPIIRHRLPKSAQYYFWLVVLASLLLPISRIVVIPENAANIAPVHAVVERNIISVSEYVSLQLLPAAPPMVNLPAQPFPAPPPTTDERVLLPMPTPPASASFSTVFMIVYPFGILIILLYSLIGYARFVKKLRRGYTRPYDFELDILGELAWGRRTPRLFISTYAATPMLIGLFKPTIVLPNREYTEEQLTGILLHELTHMRRFDIAVKWFSLIACAVHWFNPLVWITRREIDRICELSCDESVIQNMNTNDKQHYGETLIAVASNKKIPLTVLSTTMCAEKKAIKERLIAIMKSKKYTKAVVLVSMFILLAVVLVACAIGASGGNDNGSDNGNGAIADYDIYDNNEPNAPEPTPPPAPQTFQDYVDKYIENLVSSLTVGVFYEGDHDGPFYIRQASILETRIITLELEASYYDMELWRLDFMVLTDDFESEYLRWGTFSPDADGWVGHHTAWNDARTLLVFTRDGDNVSLLGSIDWWMEEYHGQEGALRAFLAEQNSNRELCYCGEHYVGEDLRWHSTPPLNIREWREQDMGFDTGIRDSFDTIHNFTFAEQVNGSFILQNIVEIHPNTIILWADETLRDFRIVVLDFYDDDGIMSFHPAETLFALDLLSPGDVILLNAQLSHYLIPRVGITFTDANNRLHRLLLQESMRGGCFPLFTLLNYEDHFAGWRVPLNMEVPATMPVFRNPFHEPRVAPGGSYFSDEEMAEIATGIINRMGLEVLNISEADRFNTIWTRGITATAEGVTVTVEMQGHAIVYFENGYPLPEGMAWERFAPILGIIPTDSNDFTEQLLDLHFNDVRFIPNAYGELREIHRFPPRQYVLRDKIGYFPIIMPAEAIERMLDGQGSFMVDMGQTRPTENEVIDIRLVYFGHNLGRNWLEAFAPWYEITVQTADSHHMQWWFVPAIRSDYLEANPAWAVYPHQ